MLNAAFPVCWTYFINGIKCQLQHIFDLERLVPLRNPFLYLCPDEFNRIHLTMVWGKTQNPDISSP